MHFGRVVVILLLINLIILPLTDARCSSNIEHNWVHTQQSQKEKLSYAFGVEAGTALNRIARGASVDFLIRGVRDQFEGNKLILSPEDIKAYKRQLMSQKGVSAKNTGTELKSPEGGATNLDLAGYAVGLDFGRSLKKVSSDVSIEFFFRGLNDVYAQEKLLVPFSEAQQLTKEYWKKKKEEKTHKAQSERIKSQITFLQSNKKKPEVMTTKSGLQYEIVEAGSGIKPRLRDRVILEYSARLLNGDEFERHLVDEHKNGIVVSSFTKGFAEGLQLMQEGGRYRLFIPDRLAYGPKGLRQLVEPYSLIIYDVYLHKVIPQR